jgi:20S proteasome subunit beta 7
MASGGSVVAVEYDGGVLMAADTLLAYGSMAKVANVPRTRIISGNAAVAATGDYADFQAATRELMGDVLDDQMQDDGVVKTPAELFNSLHRTMYHKRSEFTPYMCSMILIGHDGAKPFMAATDSIGTRWTDKCLATGYAGHICIPLLRKAFEVKQGEPLSRDEAMAVLTDCMRTLFYRECSAVNRFQVAEAANGKVVLHEPITIDTNWELQGFRFETTAIIA